MESFESATSKIDGITPEKRTERASIEPPLHKDFPDGMNPADYPGYESWSDRQWAWEFLRRNKRFRAACNKLKIIPIKSQKFKKKARQVASEFHLREFIHYTTPFKNGKDGPSFNPARVWSTIPHGSTSRTVNVQIKKGQVVVRFDLLPALDDKRIIDAQILYLELKLEATLKSLAESEGVKLTEKRNAEETPWDRLTWLRTLDAKLRKVPHAQIYESIYPERCQAAKDEGIPRREWPGRLKSLARKPQQLANERYLGLALPKEEEPPRMKSRRVAK